MATSDQFGCTWQMSVAWPLAETVSCQSSVTWNPNGLSMPHKAPVFPWFHCTAWPLLDGVTLAWHLKVELPFGLCVAVICVLVVNANALLPSNNAQPPSGLMTTAGSASALKLAQARKPDSKAVVRNAFFMAFLP